MIGMFPHAQRFLRCALLALIFATYFFGARADGEFASLFASDKRPPEVVHAVEKLLTRIKRCDSVRHCALPWYLFSRLFSWMHQTCDEDECKPLFPPHPRAVQITAENIFFNRVTHSRFVEQVMRSVTFARPDVPKGKLDHRRSAIMLRAEGANYLDGPEVAPFFHQIRCYAEMHGLELIIDRKRRLRSKFFETFQHLEALAALNVPNGSALHQHVLSVLDGEPYMLPTLADSDSLLGVSGGVLAAWARPWALEKHLAKHDFVVSLDLDMTVRPDSHDVSLVRELQLMTERTGKHSGHAIYIPDRSPLTAGDCVNGGFIAVRDSDVARMLLNFWREKLDWPGVAMSEQGALAESILELLSLEVSGSGPPSYGSECLKKLFPSGEGVSQWNPYCHCWHMAVRSMVGPFRHRRSAWVGFVNSLHIDVNYVPYSFMSEAPQANLLSLRLGHGGPDSASPLKPFIVHWAGLDGHRLRLMKEYVGLYNRSIGDWSASLACPASRVISGAQRRWLGTPVIHDPVLRRMHCKRVANNVERHLPDEFTAWWVAFGCSRLTRFVA